MANYRLSLKANDDLKLAYLYGFENFGETQADAYAAGLVDCFQLLAGQPRLGRARSEARDDLRVFFHGSHVIAYRIINAGIFIQRILDTRRDWQRILRRQ